MPFRLNRRPSLSIETPEALFRDLRNREVEGLLSHQADVLRVYQEKALEKADVALQLPTGSGKTLVGLLIGEWRRRKFGEKVVYLCPTKQLVNQVVEQATEQYGIKANAFTGRQINYTPSSKSEYLTNETLAVTTYNGIFNTNSFFDAPDIIILDDAHAAENYIASYWSLLIERNNEKPEVFTAITSLLKQALSSSDYQKLSAPSGSLWDAQWVEKIPTSSFLNITAELTALLDIQTPKTELQFQWSVLRDHLSSCHMYVSVSSVLIRPIIPPTRTHSPFAHAKQRIYMSATLGVGGDLERLTGIQDIERLPVPQGWDKQGIGRRLFCFPERSLTFDESLNASIEMIKRAGRALVLVPDNKSAEDFRERIVEQIGFSCINAQQLEQTKQEFVEKERVVAVIANRYDGIDLMGDDCRLLVLLDLPRAVNLQERFLMSRLAATVLLNDRILTRIVQAVGRCTRSANDYAAVVILGDDLNAYALKSENRAFFHPEIQAELEFGIEQSRDVAVTDFYDYLRIFLEHSEEWNDADQAILARREEITQKELPAATKLRKAVLHEVRYQYELWNGNYENAVAECRAVLTELTGPEVQGYRAFWYYLAGSAAWIGAKHGISSLDSVAREYFKHAASTVPGIPWFHELTRLRLVDFAAGSPNPQLGAVVEGLETQLQQLGMTNDRKFEREVKAILEGLNQQDPVQFEDSHMRLGRLIGYRSENSELASAPDPWWIAGDSLCFVFEDHSQAEKSSSLGSNKVRQVAGHPKWIHDKVVLATDAEIIPAIITPCRVMEPDAEVYAEDVRYWNIKDFRTWAVQSIAVIRQLRQTFPGEGDLIWQQQAAQAYKDGAMDPMSLRSTLNTYYLRDLKK